MAEPSEAQRRKEKLYRISEVAPEELKAMQVGADQPVAAEAAFGHHDHDTPGSHDHDHDEGIPDEAIHHHDHDVIEL
jgi:hypothetical protein